MSASKSRPPVRLADYRPSDYLIREVDLDIRLDRSRSEVKAVLSIAINPRGSAGQPLNLHRDGVTPEKILLDGRLLAASEFIVEDERLVIPSVPDRPFRLETLSIVDPLANTTLNGLYMSSGIYCTQCEAEGFRRITPFIDRPDVLARYRTRIEARKEEARYLLSNGNPVAAGDVAAGWHFAAWDDPWPKPSYLFALVAGNLAKVSDRFRTRSGREVRLDIFVEEGKEGRTGFAMESLKRAMRWDEERFGREYDLDVFMLVAVSDFNMGAMENKGLNVFNDKYVLADPKTATDSDFINIEAIIGHEYFHNWTGNRITCRDWFQLCVKEGLTVFRDQEFTSDVRSRPVKRITDVMRLRAAQFPEDQGPLAHPVRPEAYQEINNFYTATVYEKGAEVIRMLRTIIGDDAFNAGMDRYFTRHDGEAVTVEDFIACFAETSGRDLAPFMRWYTQAGTPEIVVELSHDAETATATLVFHQIPGKAAGDAAKPQIIPLKLALLGADGQEMALSTANGLERGDVIVLDEFRREITFKDIKERPVPSLLRGFSAPVKLSARMTDGDLLFLFRHDSDSFNRWQAGQTLATRLLLSAVKNGGQLDEGAASGYIAALAASLADQTLDEAFLSLFLNLPSDGDIAREIGTDVDPDAIHSALRLLRQRIGTDLGDILEKRYRRASSNDAYGLDAASTARRALKNNLLSLLCAPAPSPFLASALSQLTLADNMTDAFGALMALSQQASFEREEALAVFYKRHEGDALVIDKWFAAQAVIGERDTLQRVERLMGHGAFRFTNPNRVRALIGSFAFSNTREFHRPDGEGYRFLARQIMALDRINPQVAARMATAFRSWRMLEPQRRAMAQAEMERMAANPLSVDVEEIIRRMLAAA